MKKNLITHSTLFISVLSLVQVGINTSSPQGIFHADGGKDNATTGVPAVAQQANDFIVTSIGNIGIGTTAPDQKPEIQTGGTPASLVSGFELADETQASGKVLTSDTNDTGSWNTVRLLFTRLAFSGSYILPTNTTVAKYAGQYIDLPLEKWVINLVIEMNLTANPISTVGSDFVRLRLGDNTRDLNPITNTFSADAIAPKLASTGLSLSEQIGTLNGILVINNPSDYRFADTVSGISNQTIVQSGWIFQ
ncbi:hypothetical protein HNP38_000107 [Chryseobacterium defluvii]|uniref:Uncharacterized protein n=1 Tax=Chryseobacterium defluvii TaxID=160396 RepID=A0A840K8V2_9FLAO|nr:hypothetical protein [Chryseobacterium defluvii]MBB4804835.1 hypothetical protein [Chryseobacterium defluvii]